MSESLPQKPQKLDDIMLAMDVVDTLRHRALIVETELGADAREAAMIERLREIYAGQGIEVPENILRDGVKALEENRFVYEPPKNSLSVKLAKLYIARYRWLRPLVIVLALALLSVGTYRFAIVGPAKTALRDGRAALSTVYQEATQLATTEHALQRIEALARAGNDAAQNDAAKPLSAAVRELEAIEKTLATPLTIRILSRPGELSGVFRVPNDAPGTRNYYLIVEAIDPSGSAVPVEITSEEDQKTETVTKWGIRVSEAAFDAVKADKSDDQIIQNAVVGEKPVGALRPVYTDTIDIGDAGEAILDW